MGGSNPLNDGTAEFCRECDKSYREIKRLPGSVGLCPTCFEELLNGSSGSS